MDTKRNRVCAFFSFLLLATGLAGCVGKQASDTLLPSDTLRVACDFDNAPFAFVDDAGAYGGRDVEMMESLGKEMGVTIEWVKLPFEQLLPAAERNEVDAVCATVGITKKRGERVLFTRPYFATRIAALVRVGEGEPKSLHDLAGKKVAASPGTTSEFAMRSHLQNAVAVFDNTAKKKADVRLLEREVDAVVQDGPDADDFADTSEGRLTVLTEPVAIELYAIVVSPKQSAWIPRLDAALDALDRDGRLTALDARHGLSQN